MKELKHNKKKIIPVLAILIIAAGVSAYFILGNNQKYLGIIEATIATHTAEVSGKITEMPIELGAHVKKGDTLAVIESTNQQYALEQLEFTLEKRKLSLADLDSSANSSNSQKENNISLAQSNYSSAKTVYDKAVQDYENSLTLYNQGAIPKDALDNAKLKMDSASYTVSAAKAQLNIAADSTSADSANLDIAQIENQIEQAKETLDKYTIRASVDGVIISKSFLSGDIVTTGSDIVDIASDQEKYFVFYLPKDKLDLIDYDQSLTITGDGKEYVGIVKYIDVESRYTPKDMQTRANKNRESAKVKLLLPKDTLLKPGQEAVLVF